MARVSKQMEKEIADMLIHDKKMSDVVRNWDGSGAMTTCTGVDVSNDLQVVKVYLSIMSDDPVEKDRIMRRMQGLTKCAL